MTESIQRHLWSVLSDDSPSAESVEAVAKWLAESSDHRAEFERMKALNIATYAAFAAEVRCKEQGQTIAEADRQRFANYMADHPAATGNMPVASAGAKTPAASNTESAVAIGSKTTTARHFSLRPYLKSIGGVAASLLLLAGSYYALRPAASTAEIQLADLPAVADTLEAIPGVPQPQAQLIMGGKTVALLGTSAATNDNGIAQTGIYNGEDELDFSQAENLAEQMGTLRIPRGGYYKVTLDDGSHVWLNAQSELIFPSKMRRDLRHVYLKGEAYFEVAHDPTRRFVVTLESGNDIVVYGTRFNINAYDPSHITATLVEGSISCQTPSGQEVMVRPGQNADITAGGKQVNLANVDTYLYTSWKDGEFVFVDQTIEQIMDRLSTCYNITVDYKTDAIRHEKFTGIISRTDSPEKILNLLERTTTVGFDFHQGHITVK